MATIAMFGFMLRDGRHAAVVFGVMLAIAVAGATFAILNEVEPNAATTGLAVEPGPNMEGKEVRHRPGRRRHLGGVHHGDLQRLGLGDARQPQPAGRAGADGHDDAQRRLQRHRRRLPQHGLLHHRRRLPGRADGGPDAGVPRQEGRGQGGQAGDAGDPPPPAADLRRLGAVRGDSVGPGHGQQPRPARLQRDRLRVLLGRGQQRLGLRGAGRQHPALEHRHGHRPAARAVPGPDLPAGHRRLPVARNAACRRRPARSAPAA